MADALSIKTIQFPYLNRLQLRAKNPKTHIPQNAIHKNSPKSLFAARINMVLLLKIKVIQLLYLNNLQLRAKNSNAKQGL